MAENKKSFDEKELETVVRQTIESRVHLKDSIEISFTNSTKAVTVIQIEAVTEDLNQLIYQLTRANIRSELNEKAKMITQKGTVIELVGRSTATLI